MRLCTHFFEENATPHFVGAFDENEPWLGGFSWLDAAGKLGAERENDYAAIIIKAIPACDWTFLDCTTGICGNSSSSTGKCASVDYDGDYVVECETSRGEKMLLNN